MRLFKTMSGARKEKANKGINNNKKHKNALEQSKAINKQSIKREKERRKLERKENAIKMDREKQVRKLERKENAIQMDILRQEKREPKVSTRKNGTKKSGKDNEKTSTSDNNAKKLETGNEEVSNEEEEGGDRTERWLRRKAIIAAKIKSIEQQKDDARKIEDKVLDDTADISGSSASADVLPGWAAWRNEIASDSKRFTAVGKSRSLIFVY